MLTDGLIGGPVTRDVTNTGGGGLRGILVEHSVTFTVTAGSSLHLGRAVKTRRHQGTLSYTNVLNILHFINLAKAFIQCGLQIVNLESATEDQGSEVHGSNSILIVRVKEQFSGTSTLNNLS